MRVLVLGKTGMLGSMLHAVLKYKGLEVYGTQRKNERLLFYLNLEEQHFYSDVLKNISPKPDFIVNCIGVKDFDRNNPKRLRLNFWVNALFPAYLQRFGQIQSIKIIHISTDGVFSSSNYPFYEDNICNGLGDYALSKILGEIRAPNVINIRCSIIGKELNTQKNLLDWFLSRQEGETIDGYTNHIWNGVTTLQLSEFIHTIFKDNLFDEIVQKTNIIHYSPNLPLTKYELLGLLKEIYNKNIDLTASEADIETKRILNSRFDYFYMKDKKKYIKEQIVKMIDFIDQAGFIKEN